MLTDIVKYMPGNRQRRQRHLVPSYRVSVAFFVSRKDGDRMAVRYRKYFKECKPIQCTGRRSKQCPETPKRSSGDYKACGVWCIDFFDDNKQWRSLTFRDIRNKSDAEKRLTLFISDRERG